MPQRKKIMDWGSACVAAFFIKKKKERRKVRKCLEYDPNDVYRMPTRKEEKPTSTKIKKKGTQGTQGFMVSSCIIIQKVSPAFEDTRADGEVQTIDQEMRIWPQHRGPFNRH